MTVRLSLLAVGCSVNVPGPATDGCLDAPSPVAHRAHVLHESHNNASHPRPVAHTLDSESQAESVSLALEARMVESALSGVAVTQSIAQVLTLHRLRRVASELLTKLSNAL